MWKTNGGRVLNAVAEGASLDEALGKSYALIAKLNSSGIRFRRDIGKSKKS